MTTLKTAVVPKEIQDNAYEKNLRGGGWGEQGVLLLEMRK